jgi:glutaconate CoA-transferase subunit B
MRVKSVHAGHTIEEVLDNTGFDVLVPERVPTTPAPSAEQLDVLRGRLDPDGALRAS